MKFFYVINIVNTSCSITKLSLEDMIIRLTFDPLLVTDSVLLLLMRTTPVSLCPLSRPSLLNKGCQLAQGLTRSLATWRRRVSDSNALISVNAQGRLIWLNGTFTLTQHTHILILM